MKRKRAADVVKPMGVKVSELVNKKIVALYIYLQNVAYNSKIWLYILEIHSGSTKFLVGRLLKAC